MSSSAGIKSVWLGYARLGGSFNLREDEMKRGIALLGHGAKELAALFAYACNEAGLRTAVLDMDGYVSERVSGYISSYDLSYFLYDVCRVDENATTHGQLAASAYTLALDLSFEQEAIMNGTIQKIAAERGVASPSAMYNDLAGTEGFRGPAIDQLKGRLAALKSLNIIGEADVVKGLCEGGSFIANFSSAEPPEAAELSASLFLAKLLTLIGRGDSKKPDVIILTDAHRVFKFHSIRNHSDRLLITLLSAPCSRVFVSEIDAVLDRNLVQTCPVRFLSSSAWNDTTRGGLLLTPNMFMLQNTFYGNEEPFIPRPFEVKQGAVKTGAVNLPVNDELVRNILEIIESNPGATRLSIASFLSAEHDKELVERTIDKLQLDGNITTASTDTRADYPLKTLLLTDAGRELLRSPM